MVFRKKYYHYYWHSRQKGSFEETYFFVKRRPESINAFHETSHEFHKIVFSSKSGHAFCNTYRKSNIKFHLAYKHLLSMKRSRSEKHFWHRANTQLQDYEHMYTCTCNCHSFLFAELRPCSKLEIMLRSVLRCLQADFWDYVTYIRT